MKHTSPLVSIIMAVKDTEPYLQECLDSILNQTYSNWELIAVNDHSSDNSKNILDAYALKDKRVRVYGSQGNKLIAALQTGYQHVNGQLINRMDSDDKMPDYKLQVMVENWQQYGKGHVIAGGTQHFVDKGEVGGGFLRYDAWLNEVAKTNTHYEQVYTECTIPSHCWLIHKEDFDSVGAFNSSVYPEDYDLTFRFYRQKLKIIGLDKVLHHWRDRTDRISRTWEVYQDNRYFELKLKYFYELDRDPQRPLVLWGAGKNGKDLAKLVLHHESTFHWVCDNDQKVGKDIYSIRMKHFEEVEHLKSPQLLIAVSSPDGKQGIKERLGKWGKKPVRDFWFFC